MRAIVAIASLILLSAPFLNARLPGPTVQAGVTAGDLCPPLPGPSGPVVTVSSESALRTQSYAAAAGTTILVSAGTYNMGDYLHIVNDGITLRGATGNRSDVILDFGGNDIRALWDSC